MSDTCKGWDDANPVVVGVEKKQKLYRIVDFYSAAQAISENTLYVPLASQFDDPNEGLDSAIQLLAVSAGPCAGITRTFKSMEELVEYQKSAAGRTYVSCWSKTRESVAMWALYSQDFASVRITTDVESLERATIDFVRDNYDPMTAINGDWKDGKFLDKTSILSVRYDNFSELARKIDRRRRAYDKVDAAGLIKSVERSSIATTRDRARLDQYKFSELGLKDSSFMHEAEVRLVLEFTPYNLETLEIAAADTKEKRMREGDSEQSADHERHMISYARAILREENWVRKLACDPFIMLPLCANFISEVSIDPRCSPHKKKFMREYFARNGVPVVESTCFGHAAKYFSVVPREKVLKKAG